MNILSAADVYSVVGLAKEGRSVRYICRETGAATATITAYRNILFENEGVPWCGCGEFSVLHRGRCLWRRIGRKLRTGIARRNGPEDRKIVDRCDSKVLRAIHKSTGYSAYYIPIGM